MDRNRDICSWDEKVLPKLRRVGAGGCALMTAQLRGERLAFLRTISNPNLLFGSPEGSKRPRKWEIEGLKAGHKLSSRFANTFEPIS